MFLDAFLFVSHHAIFPSSDDSPSSDAEEASCGDASCGAGVAISGTGGSGAMLGFFREGLPVLGGGGGAEAGAEAGGSGAGGRRAMTRGGLFKGAGGVSVGEAAGT